MTGPIKERMLEIFSGEDRAKVEQNKEICVRFGIRFKEET